jgi:hypothetical protein
MDRIDELERKLRTEGTLTYDDAADLFELTHVGQATMGLNHMSRADMLALLRAKFPDEQALTAVMRKFLASFDRHIRRGMH